ncbi:hypothetical protein D9M72_551910 [compost metagenome]
MPAPAEPSTRLSRVVPQDACLTTSTSVMPCLSKNPFSLAMINGAESVRAMKPRTALVVSGPADCAKAPVGKAVLTAPKRAAVAVVFSRLRRVSPPVENLIMRRLLCCCRAKPDIKKRRWVIASGIRKDPRETKTVRRQCLWQTRSGV